MVVKHEGAWRLVDDLQASLDQLADDLGATALTKNRNMLSERQRSDYRTELLSSELPCGLVIDEQYRVVDPATGEIIAPHVSQFVTRTGRPVVQEAAVPPVQQVQPVPPKKHRIANYAKRTHPAEPKYAGYARYA